MITAQQAIASRNAPLAGAAAVCGGLTVALPFSFPGDGGQTDADRDIATPIHTALDSRPGVYEALVIPSNGYILLPLLLIGAGWFAYRREWWRAATMLVVPELAVAINTWLLKPLWERPLHDYLAYPSGHTVHLVAIATTFALLTDSVRARAAVLVIGVAALIGAAVGMIGLGYHLPTDILGGAAAAIAMVIVLRLAAEWLTNRIRAGSAAARG
ncbi:phosphatase PAP2 family protein [Nocardia australiensis]|uniref:phosphatase PAP2 family protein n=1 Tax=Nocardia australiensis TaxID=2887191 RepID=UPI001D154938|nr:phosphatase PAP2 family protein [Nocardia australiensis]